MAQHAADRFDIYPVLEGQRCGGVAEMDGPLELWRRATPTQLRLIQPCFKAR